MKVSELIEQLQTIENQESEVQIFYSHELCPLAGIAQDENEGSIILCDSDTLDAFKGGYNE